MMTPVSQKLNATKKKHFAKCAPPFAVVPVPDEADMFVSLCRGTAKPMPSLFGQQKDATSDSDSEETSEQTPAAPPSTETKMDEDENPF